MKKIKRDFLSLADINLLEARRIFKVATNLKHEPKGKRLNLLAGHSVAIIMEKASTRTRASFEIGAAQLGAHPVVISQEGSQLGRGEPIADTARVLARYCDLIVFRTSASERLNEMAANSSVPVINALTDDGHPVQILCDVFTIEEALGRSVKGLKVAWVGDGASNMARSFLQAAQLFGFTLHLAAPKGYLPPAKEMERAKTGGYASFGHDPIAAIKDANVINTDVWTSMGFEAENKKRLRDFAGWTLNEKLLKNAAKDAIVLHCLPAHRGQEIDNAVIEGPRSRVWDQAENRLHVQKALMLFLLNKSI